MLATWIADRDYELKRESAALRAAAALGNPPDPGIDLYGDDSRAQWDARTRALDRAVADARGLAIHEYRDRSAGRS
jgi:hypothetical protein